jgi:hypothetical protein
MALTNFSDVFVSVHEDGFNQILTHVKQQRPSLFHYGTQAFVDDFKLLCCGPEKIHPEVNKRGNPIVHREDFLPILGSTGDYGLEFNFSLLDLLLDFEPTNKFILPDELGKKLLPQAFALKAVVCGGIACPNEKDLDKYIQYPEPYRPNLSFGKGNNAAADPKDNKDPNITFNKPKKGLPFDQKTINCFRLELFAVLNFAREDFKGEPVLGLKLQNLELVDIKPDGLENSLECFMKATLRFGILPRLRVAFNALALTLGDFIQIVPTPISANVPFNPAVGKDTLSIFLNLQNP